MEDLASVQSRYMDRVFKANKDLQAPDLISRAIYAITRSTFVIVDAFNSERFESKPIRNADRKTLLEHVKAGVEWTTTLFYIEEIDLPEIEDLLEIADEFAPEIESDAVLAALHVQRSLADYSLEYFCSDDNDVAPLEALESLTEILACFELIARRLGTTLPDLI